MRGRNRRALQPRIDFLIGHAEQRLERIKLGIVHPGQRLVREGTENEIDLAEASPPRAK